VFSEQTEHLDMCAAITQAYILLAPENFLKVCPELLVVSEGRKVFYSRNCSFFFCRCTAKKLFRDVNTC